MKITAAAIRTDDGVVHSLPAPARHHTILKHMQDVGEYSGSFLKGQGFVTEDGRFLDREAAAEEALTTGQVTKLIAPPNLYSEDLW